MATPVSPTGGCGRHGPSTTLRTLATSPHRTAQQEPGRDAGATIVAGAFGLDHELAGDQLTSRTPRPARSRFPTWCTH
jgi:hypothetical protein